MAIAKTAPIVVICMNNDLILLHHQVRHNNVSDCASFSLMAIVKTETIVNLLTICLLPCLLTIKASHAALVVVVVVVVNNNGHSVIDNNYHASSIYKVLVEMVLLVLTAM